MDYFISIGYINPSSKKFKERVSELLENGNGDKGIGIHRLFPKLNFDKLDNDIPDDKRRLIFDNYYNICGEYYRDTNIREKSWVSHPKLTSYRGTNVRHITDEFLENFKNDVKGGRELFRAIKDSYVDNDTKPNIEVCMVNTPSFKNALKMVSKSVLEEKDLKIEYIDFIKWFYYWSVRSLSDRGPLTSVKFTKD